MSSSKSNVITQWNESVLLQTDLTCNLSMFKRATDQIPTYSQ